MKPNIAIFLPLSVLALQAAPLKDAELQAYFADEVNGIEANCLTDPKQWPQEKARRREELFEMLSLSPLPEKSDLKAVVTGKNEADEIVVENIHFQSLTGLYVTANFYRPKTVDAPLPTILYVCGHAQVKTNGISYGNKTAYQHHGIWFAKHGYTCLVLDTIQLGEIEGIHHGTYREGMWWWNSRGYTPAGVEAWNCIRALDYLETRPEVDAKRFGVTGRSGGGAYSWWVAALDDRIKVAAPVAGITDLRNHVVDGVVEGHCDCMFFMNTYRWDYPMVAALVAPRPLLLCNSDKDGIFPLDGVIRTHSKVREVYKVLNAETNLGLLITEGPHKDTQDLQLPVFRWFNRHLKGEDPLILDAATRLFSGQQLKVFENPPADERTSRIHESFVSEAKGTPGSSELREILRTKVFRGWPESGQPLNLKARRTEQGLMEFTFDSQPHVRLALLLPEKSRTSERFTLRIFDASRRPAEEKRLAERKADEAGIACLFVRPVGEEKTQSSIQIRRRYMLVGQTLDGMRVWDILRGIEALHSVTELAPGLEIEASGREANNAILAAVLDRRIGRLHLPSLEEFRDKSDYLNLLRYTSFDALLKEVVRP